MNNQIKFRAWVGKMEHDISTGIFGKFFVNSGKRGDGLDDNDSATLTPFKTKLPDDAPLMQFTGLKDKNGKEIYEGDILRYGHFPPTGVYWNDDMASFCLTDKQGLPIGAWQFLAFEVIGNIHENLELLA